MASVQDRSPAFGVASVSAEQNKTPVRQFLDEVYNKGNLKVADELVTASYISHNELNIEFLGPQGIRNSAALQRTWASSWGVHPPASDSPSPGLISSASRTASWWKHGWK